MYKIPSSVRVLAAAVSSAWVLAPAPSFAANYSCSTADFSVNPDGNGNLNISCTAPGTTPTPTPSPTPTPTPTPSPTPTGLTPCAGFANTHFIKLNWGAIGTGNVSVFTAQNGGFTNNEAVVVYFTTPNQNQTSSTSLGKIAGLQYVDQPVGARTSKLSAAACDFTGAYTGTDTVGASFSVGVSVSRYGVTYPMLQPNTTYYFNINNRDKNGNDTCAPGQSCNMIIQLYKPSGL